MSTENELRRKRISIGTIMLRGDIGVLMALVIFVSFLSIFSNGFFTSKNFFNVSRSFSLWVIIGFAQMSVLLIGHMNLSVGAIGGLSGIATGFLFHTYSSPAWLAVSVGITVGIVCGLLNGLIITKSGINAFIVTLAMSSVYTGIIFGFTHALSYPTVPDVFKFIGGGSIFGTIPILLLIMIAIAIVLWLLFNHTILGRWILATGGNRDAARLSGINISNITLFVHILSGVMSAIAGILFVARLSSAHTSIGTNWLLLSFAIPIIGGTALEGGKTSIFGVVLGGILMTVISNGLVLLRVDPFLEQFFLGLCVLIAVGVDRVRTIYAERRYF